MLIGLSAVVTGVSYVLEHVVLIFTMRAILNLVSLNACVCVQRQEGKFTEPRARFYLGEIVLALNYLHAFSIIFR